MKRNIIVETTDLKHCLIAANFFRNCNTPLYLIRQRGVWQLSARYKPGTFHANSSYTPLVKNLTIEHLFALMGRLRHRLTRPNLPI